MSAESTITCTLYKKVSQWSSCYDTFLIFLSSCFAFHSLCLRHTAFLLVPSGFCILHSGLYSVGVALARQSTDSLRHGLEPSTRVGSLVAQSTGSVECLDPRD